MCWVFCLALVAAMFLSSVGVRIPPNFEKMKRIEILTKDSLVVSLEEALGDPGVRRVWELIGFGEGAEFWTVPEGGEEEGDLDWGARVVVGGRLITSEMAWDQIRQALLDGGKDVRTTIFQT